MRGHRLTGLLAAGMILAVGCAPIAGAGGSSESPLPSGTIELVVETDTGAAFEFEPGTIVASAGGTIRLVFRNRSTEIHNLAFTELTELRTRTLVAPGGSDEITFPAPGPGQYRFVCTVHTGMAGALVVPSG